MAINRLNKTFVDGEVWDAADINPISSKVDEVIDQVNLNTDEIVAARNGEASLNDRINNAETSAWSAAAAAQTSAANAATSEANALSYKNAAETAAANAATSETNAAQSAANAATSESNALTYSNDSYGWANTGEDASFTDSQNRTGYSAYHYAQKASASASAAATSEANAKTSETNAANSAAQAATSASNAATSETNSLNYLNDFKGRYYGAYSSDPTTDPLGNPIDVGDVYYNTTENKLKYWTGSTWDYWSQDADTLDGLDSSRYHKAAVSTFSGGDWNSLTQHGTYKIQHETFDNDTNYPPAIYPYGILLVFISEFGGENRISQIYIPHQPYDKYIYERMFNNSNWTEWRKIWRGGTGSGSGLDADLLDGYHASQTPAPNVIVPLDANGVLDLSATYVRSNVYTFRRVDLTNATSDYMLQVGEEAYISFSDTRSVPLRIATQSGTYYECHLVCSNTGGTSGGTLENIYLNPNNTTYSDSFGYVEFLRNTTGWDSGYKTYSALRCGAVFASSVFYITNFVQYKNAKGIYDMYGTSSSYPYLFIFSTDWQDTTTPWTSLGTITFPQASSGYIVVRRLV